MSFKNAIKEFGLFVGVILFVIIIFIYSFYGYNLIQVPLLDYMGISFPSYKYFIDYGYTFLLLSVVPAAISRSTTAKTDWKLFNLCISLSSVALSYLMYQLLPVKFLGFPSLSFLNWLCYILSGVVSYLPLGLIFIGSYFGIRKIWQLKRQKKSEQDWKIIKREFLDD